MEGDGKSLEQKIVGDKPSVHGQMVLFYFHDVVSYLLYNTRAGEEGSEDSRYSS
jgi:hypothetical protein